MTTGNVHENLKESVGKLVHAVASWSRAPHVSCGETTWKSADAERGLESRLDWARRAPSPRRGEGDRLATWPGFDGLAEDFTVPFSGGEKVPVGGSGSSLPPWPQRNRDAPGRSVLLLRSRESPDGQGGIAPRFHGPGRLSRTRPGRRNRRLAPSDRSSHRSTRPCESPRSGGSPGTESPSSSISSLTARTHPSRRAVSWTSRWTRSTSG